VRVRLAESSPAAITRAAGRHLRHHLKPTIRPPPERALAANDGCEAGARAMQSFVAGFAAATVDASAAVKSASDGHEKQSRKRARPASPQRDPHPRAREQTSHDLRHAQPQGHRAQHERQRQGAHAPQRRWPHPCPSRNTRNQARGQKRAALAHAEAPANPQDLAAVGVAQGVVRETVIQMRPPSEAIDAKSQGRRDARNRHEALGESLTAVP